MEIKEIHEYAASKVHEMQKLLKEFEEVESSRLMWDSKVPKGKKKFYNFFTLSASSREEILYEIRKYLDFYEKITSAVLKLSNNEDISDSNTVHVYTIIRDLSEKLNEMIEAAKSGKVTTRSSAVYELHKTFIADHEELENMIKTIKREASKKKVEKYKG